MQINLKEQVTNIKGDALEMSFPSDEQVNNLPKNEKGLPDRSKLPRETVGNMLLNCLGFYSNPKDRKEVFMVFDLGQRLMKAEDTIELDENDIKFLTKVINESLYDDSEEGKKPKGIYRMFGIGQLLNAIGVKDN